MKRTVIPRFPGKRLQQLEKLTQHIFGQYKNFEIKLYTIFKDPNKKKTAKHKLAKLQQTKSTSTYTAQFQQITSQLQ